MVARFPLLLATVLLFAATRAHGDEPGGPSLPLDEIVRLDTSRAADDRRGLGVAFFVSPRRIATNWHVLSPWDDVQATLRKGEKMTIRGVAAASAELDLAILDLTEPVKGVRGLELAVDPLAGKQQAWAVGHPQGDAFVLRSGVVGREIRTSQLAARPQAFVRRAIGGDKDLRWLQHSVPLTDGDSGGPLFDARGRVLGVNTWVDDTTHAAYALHAAQLAEFLEQPTGEPRSLAEVRAALAEKSEAKK
ncbi:MAG: serine protease [Pirellulales bacterium]